MFAGRRGANLSRSGLQLMPGPPWIKIIFMGVILPQIEARAIWFELISCQLAVESLDIEGNHFRGACLKNERRPKWPCV